MHGGAIDVEAHGTALQLALQLGRTLAIGALDVDFALAAGAPQPDGGDLAARGIRLDARATNVVGPQGTFNAAHARLDGTLARHTLSVAFDQRRNGRRSSRPWRPRPRRRAPVPMPP